MLSSISWSQYITVLLLFLGCYYIFVGYKYFRWEVLSLIGIRKVEDNKAAIPVAEIKKQFTVSNNSDYLPKESLDADISPVVQSFSDEVQAYLQQTKPNVQEPELLYSLQLIAVKYPALKDADCKNELIQMIFNEVNSKYPGLIELSDLQILWK